MIKGLGFLPRALDLDEHEQKKSIYDKKKHRTVSGEKCDEKEVSH